MYDYGLTKEMFGGTTEDVIADGLGMLKRTSDDGTTVECLEKAHIQLG